MSQKEHLRHINALFVVYLLYLSQMSFLTSDIAALPNPKYPLPITTAFLPHYIFCRDQLLVSYLLPSESDGAKHARAILALLVKQLRQAWPKVRIIFRGESGFCRWWVLSWCEHHAVGYIVGVAKNKQLNAMTAQRQREAQEQIPIPHAFSRQDSGSRTHKYPVSC